MHVQTFSDSALALARQAIRDGVGVAEFERAVAYARLHDGFVVEVLTFPEFFARRAELDSRGVELFHGDGDDEADWWVEDGANVLSVDDRGLVRVRCEQGDRCDSSHQEFDDGVCVLRDLNGFLPARFRWAAEV